MAEGWEASPYISNTNDSLARQDATSAIKGVLGSFCVLDEERRFELFQLSARLEARWGLELSPALMHAITDITEHALYKRALEPYMLNANMIEPENERLIEAVWMMQELPRKKPSVLLVVTNRALYLLETPKLVGVCQLCESWKLCPSGPKLTKRIPLYKISRMTLDFTAGCGAGHRIKITYAGQPHVAVSSSVLRGCTDAAHVCGAAVSSGARKSWQVASFSKPEEKEADSKDAEEAAEADQVVTKKKKKVEETDLQLSSLLVGVVQSVAQAIKAGIPHHPPPTILDSSATRGIQLQNALERQAAGKKSRAVSSIDAYLEPFDFTVAMKVEYIKQKEGKEINLRSATEVLLILTDKTLDLYTENPSLFAHAAAMDSSEDSIDGMDMLKMKESIDLQDVNAIELEMSAEPRARLSLDGHKILLCFADDTGAMLWRHHMRRALWGTGQATWTGASLSD